VKTRIKTNDVMLLDDGETWGGLGKIVRMTPAVEKKYKDELDNGGLEEVCNDKRVEILNVETLIEIFDHLRNQVHINNPELQSLIKEAIYAHAG
jgi:hypothetical protein